MVSAVNRQTITADSLPAAAAAPSSARKKHKQASSSGSLEPSALGSGASFFRWSTLYSDALYSVFKFATLNDLSRLMNVSRRWGDAVMTMPPIAVSVFIRDSEDIQMDSRLDAVLDSRLCRHVASLLQRDPWGQSEPFHLSTAQLERASVRAPWMTEIAVEVSNTMDHRRQRLPSADSPSSVAWS